MAYVKGGYHFPFINLLHISVQNRRRSNVVRGLNPGRGRSLISSQQQTGCGAHTAS